MITEVLTLVFDMLTSTSEIDVRLMVSKALQLFVFKQSYTTVYHVCLQSAMTEIVLDLSNFDEQEQYRGQEEILKRCLKLLKALARGNDLIQMRMFERLDILLKIKVVESEVAIALKEVGVFVLDRINEIFT